MAKNRQRGIVVLALLTGLAVGPAFASDIRFGFSFSGGMGFIDGGDLNKYIADSNAWVQDYIDRYSPHTYSIDWKEMKQLPNYGGELFVRIGRFFGLSFGFEYITNSNRGMLDYVIFGTYEEDRTTYYKIIDNYREENAVIDQTLTVVPITLSLYGHIPLGLSTEVYVKAGVGYYFGTLATIWSEDWYIEDHEFNYNYNGTPIPSLPHWHSLYEGSSITDSKASCHTMGFHAGAGLNLNLTRNIALFAEAFYRMVNFNDWQGTGAYAYDQVRHYGGSSAESPIWDTLPFIVSSTVRDSFTGMLWSYDEITDWLASYAYTKYGFYEAGDEPEEIPGWIENIRPTKINLNGLTIKAGIKILFGIRR